MKILAIGAHYDDIEIGCGGTILKHISKGDDIYFAVTSSDEYRTGSVEIRYDEQLKSLSLMNIEMSKLFRFSYKDDTHDVIGELDKLSPNLVFTHHEFDTHQDHRRASVIGQAVGRKKHVATMFYDSGSSYDFYPNVFSMIDYNKKYKLLACYESQIKCGALNLDRLKKKSSYWASLVSCNVDDYVEGLLTRKMIYEVK